VDVLFDGAIHAHYGQFYVESSNEAGNDGDPIACFRAQANGICGAAVAGMLFLITGLHTGDVALRIERHDAEPPLGDEWEDVVEVSLLPRSDEVALVQWAAEARWRLELSAIDYRVRYSATGMDEANRTDTTLDGEPLIDRHLMQAWPAQPKPDRVLRQTSDLAAYWHTAWR
jgi:hypothetical protein